MENTNSRTVKISYEELEKIATQLSEQNKYYYEELQKAQATIRVVRLEYLFKVIEFKDVFNTEFLNACIEEIEETLKRRVEENE